VQIARLVRVWVMQPDAGSVYDTGNRSEEKTAMPKVALADLFADWEGLLRTAARYKDHRTMDVHVDKLQAAFERLRELQARREELQAQLLVATQEMGEVKEAGKVAAVEVRSVAKAILGHSNERLVEFNVRPIRKRGPRRKRTTEPPQTS
jgi:hypothetical protein